MKSAEADWKIDLNVECPHCGYYQDIMREIVEQEWPVDFGERKDFNTEESDEELVVICGKSSCHKQFCISKTNY